MIELKNNRLRLDVCEPGEIYKGSRFDWTGHVRQVTLDGEYDFLLAEGGRDGCGGGFGLCHEFNMRDAIGYEDIPVGKWFPKIGVGSLRKQREKFYCFIPEYEMKGAQHEYSAGADRIEFRSGLKCREYEMHLERTLSLSGNSLCFNMQLKNSGSRNFRIEEYCHNFLAPVGMDNSARFSLDSGITLRDAVKHVDEEGIMQLKDQKISFSADTAGTYYYRQAACLGDGPVDWQLSCPSGGLVVRGREDFSPVCFALWGRDFTICPEYFCGFDLDAGTVCSWSRTYTFDRIC